jgi:hypothetical protein
MFIVLVKNKYMQNKLHKNYFIYKRVTRQIRNMATSHFADVTCVLDASHTAPHKSNLFNLLKTAVTQKKRTNPIHKQ